MKKIIKNKVSLTLNLNKNERTLSSNPQVKNQITNSAYTMRRSNMIDTHKDYSRKNNNTNNSKYSICNTSPNNKIQKHLNLTRTLQNIVRSSRSKEGILSNKLVHKSNALNNINSNTNYINTNANRHTTNLNNISTGNNHLRINLPLTENAQKMKYQRVTIKTNNNITNITNNNYNHRISTNINDVSSPSNKNFCYANSNKVRISHKAYGIIQAYATITSSGKRNYNEDRVSIIYNITKPPGYTESKNKMPWPNCSFFGLYDGHGGNRACDFLRDNLHKYIINDKYFPSNPQKAIANAFIYAEKLFFKNYTGIDSSGSCAIIVLIIEKRVYIANVGDSRAVLSAKNGTKLYPLSRDHRPGDEKEYKRILDAGGKIYKTEYEYGNRNSNTYTNAHNTRYSYTINNNRNNTNSSTNNNSNYNNRRSTASNSSYNSSNNRNSSVVGPLRVSPGKLSVSRTIGDIEAKDPKFGGNPNVIISIPEIKYFDNTDKNDFILIFCDGVYEKLKNQDIIDCIWKEIKAKKFADIHNMAGYTIEKLVNKCMIQDSRDNLTVIMICLKTYEKLKIIETPVPQTENIDISKTKILNIAANISENIRKRSTSKKPLSILLTKLIHNNSQNIRKVINLKNKDTKDNKDINKDNNKVSQYSSNNTQYSQYKRRK